MVEDKIMSLGWVTAGMMAVNLIGTITGAQAEQRAYDDEADAQAAQAVIQRQEELEEAERLDKEYTRFLARQSLMFLKGGVSLSGSPLLVLTETREERKKQVQAQIDRANAIYEQGLGAARRTSRQGRSALVGGVIGGVTSTASMYLAGRSAGVFTGMFGKQQTATKP